MRFLLAAMLFGLYPAWACAWWDDAWGSRREISVDAGATGADIEQNLLDVPVLLRLHSGNFAYFAELAEGGNDLRFLADDRTPMPHDVEMLDVINEIGLVWVKLNRVDGAAGRNGFRMYYGNADAADASNGKSLYDASQGLVYHFAVDEPLPRDATAYASHAAESTAQIDTAGWIGAAAKFDGSSHIRVGASPQLAVSPDNGWTFSTWLKIDQAQSGALVMAARDGSDYLQLAIQESALVAGGGEAKLPPVPLTLGRWQQLVLVVRPNNLSAYAGDKAAQNPRSYAPPQIMELYLDGVSVASAVLRTVPRQPSISLGEGLVGWLDEVQIAAGARGADWIKFAFRSQSLDYAVLGFGEDESNDSGDSHLLVIVQSTTVDGWVVIALTMIMLVIAGLVMVTKALVIKRVGNDNRLFLEQYRQLDHKRLGALDFEASDEERELADSDFLTAPVGRHDRFQSSTLYHLYHLAIHELKQLQSSPDQVVSTQAWNFLKVKLDSQVVNEVQRLNSNMVLLTIAVAGGPFLGLLGTVVGVMNTFAAIAASGDVNINAIAPGIAAALLTTVAGLCVAIPSLFGYNYLMTRIKEITVGMKVFADEFLALLSMRAAQTKEP